MERTCVCCKKIFLPHPAVINQQYCSDRRCQRVRKRKWQKAKLAKDSDYRKAQAEAQKQWCNRNKGYWRTYRQRNPEYRERNRLRQRERNRQRGCCLIAKMDEQKAKNPITSGRYRLIRVCNERIAKMDELIVEIDVISRGLVAGVQMGV